MKAADRQAIALEFPVYRVPPNYANVRMHYRDAAREASADKRAVQAAWISTQRRFGAQLPALPVRCKLTLCARKARDMDLDNLARRLKPVRDAVAKVLGVDDKDHAIGGQVAWVYEAETALPTMYQSELDRYGVLVELEPLHEEPLI